MFQLAIATDNDAIQHHPDAIADILEHAAREVRSGRGDLPLRDANGNTVGSAAVRTGSRRSHNVAHYACFAVVGVDEDDLTASIKQVVLALGGEIEPCNYVPDESTVEDAIDPKRTFGGLIDLSPPRPDEEI